VGAGEGVGGGVGFGGGVAFGVSTGGLTGLSGAEETRTGATARRARCVRATGRFEAWCTIAGRFTGVCTMCTTGGFGAGVMTRGVAILCSAGELDSKAARQRYPEVTPAATSRQSRSASNEIRTRISIDLPPDSIGADMQLG
jgi:hypothetical protein